MSLTSFTLYLSFSQIIVYLLTFCLGDANTMLIKMTRCMANLHDLGTLKDAWLNYLSGASHISTNIYFLSSNCSFILTFLAIETFLLHYTFLLHFGFLDINKYLPFHKLLLPWYFQSCFQKCLIPTCLHTPPASRIDVGSRHHTDQIYQTATSSKIVS